MASIFDEYPMTSHLPIHKKIYLETVKNYIASISATKKGVRILIADHIAVEQLAFLEITRHYLPESTTDVVDESELQAKLENKESEYDLVILEESFLIDWPDGTYVKAIRKEYPKAKIALFIDRDNLYRLRSPTQFSDVDLVLTKRAAVEVIAEKLCLMFQETP